MITGIDRPSGGEIVVTDREVHRMSENQLSGWRGENVGSYRRGAIPKHGIPR